MKRKTRDIVVENRKYIWLVNERMWPEIQLKIWRAGEKRIPLVDENWGGGAITPKIVSERIKQAELDLTNKK